VRRFFFLTLKSGKEHRVTSEELVRLNYRGSGSAWRGAVVPLAFLLLLAIGVIAVGLGFDPALRHAAVSSSLPTFLSPAANHMAAVPSQTSLARLPLIFEPNQGQTASQVQFLAHGIGHGLFLTADGAVLAMRDSAGKTAIIRMALDRANKNPAASGDERLPGKSNYFIGNDPAKWRRDIPQFARVRYENVYPGVELVYYGNQGRLEYDFKVAPGADPKQVALRFEAQQKPRLDGRGNLLLGNGVRLEAPRVYQKIGDQERSVAGRFALAGNRVTLEIGEYDRTRALIIDPTLGFSTFLGGGGDEACSSPAILNLPSPPPGCPAVAVDSALNIYIAGSTTSADFPTAGSPFQASNGGGADAFITKLDPTGATILFSTYLGGDGRDTPAGVGVDSASNVAIAGTTTSTNFPTSSSPFQAGPQSGTHAFVSEVDSAGHALLYSTYLAGDGIDSASGLAEDVRGKLYVTGTTTSSNFPTTIGSFQPTPLATSQSFMSKIDPTLLGSSSLAYSTCFGGGNPTTGTTIGGGIAVDQNNNVYITGGTNFLHVGNADDFPILNGYQSCLNVPPPSSTTTPPPSCTPTPGPTDAFLAKFNLAAASGAQLVYSTYLGGAGNDVGYAVAADTGNAYITGSTTSSDFVIPSGTTPFQKCLDAPSNPATCPAASASDAFIAKFGNPSTSSTTTSNVPLVYFSYLGGSGTDVGLGIAIDSLQGAHVTGWTNSGDFPLGSGTPIQSGLAGGIDAFISRVDTSVQSATAPGHFGTYLGGSASDFGTSITTDSLSNTYVVGETASGNFKTQSPLQGLKGGTDAFVAKLVPKVSLNFSTTPPTVTPSPVGVGNQVTFKYTITNTGDPVSGVTFTDNLPSSTLATFVSATTAGGSAGNGCSAPVNSTVQCNLGTIEAAAVPTVTVILTPITAPTTLGNNGVQVSANGVGTVNAPPVSAIVNDFQVTVAPPTASVTAGMPATYTVTVTPTGAIPNTISLSCSSSLPTGATCTFPNGASIPNLNNGSAVTRQLVINTTARVTTPASLWKTGGPMYAIWFPLSGLALLGVGLGGKITRKKHGLLALLLAGFIGLIVFQAGCSSSRSTNITTGTPAGTYPLTITSTSGSASRTFPISLTVN
jgi:hypothetical protein